MNDATYQSNGLPNNYGNHFTPFNDTNAYLIEIVLDFIRRACGTLLVKNKRQFGGKTTVHNGFKMGEPKFIRQLDIQQTVKYGAVLYIVAAMVAIPAGICSSSYQVNALHWMDIAPPKAQVPMMVQGDTALLTQAGVNDQAQDEETPQPVEGPDTPPFHSHILRASQTYEVDAALIRAIIMAESSNNPRAVSHRGAQGLMQLMPTTAKWLGVEDAFDPALNIDGGVRYFKRLLDRFNGDVKLALAAYNAGSRYVLKYRGIPPFKATRLYIQKVLEYRQKFQEETASNQNSLTMS